MLSALDFSSGCVYGSHDDLLYVFRCVRLSSLVKSNDVFQVVSIMCVLADDHFSTPVLTSFIQYNVMRMPQVIICMIKLSHN